MKINFVLLVFIAAVLISGCNEENPHKEISLKKNESVERLEIYSGNSISKYSESVFTEGASLKKISAKEIKQHIGDSLNVTGYVAEVYLSDKVAYLNMESKFPKNIFSCTIFSSKFYEFGDLSAFKGKNIEVTGKVTTFKNKIQIILNSKDQIKIIQ